MATREEHPTDEQSTSLGFLARLWWMLGGNVLLALSLIFIFRNQGSFFHPADGVFLWASIG